MSMRKRTYKQSFLKLIVLIVVLNVVGSFLYERFDVTHDKRYTLSEATLEIIDSIQSPILVEVLLQGEFPVEFKRLQSETRQLLEEISAYNTHIKYTFQNPIADAEVARQVQQELLQIGITPTQISTKESGRMTQNLVYPWAIVSHDKKAVKIPLLKNQMGSTTEDRVNNSVQNLEYAFADALKKLTTQKQKKVAVLKGNGELDDAYIADFFSTLREYYFIAPFTLDSVAKRPRKTLEELKAYDLIVVAKPTEPFSDKEKLVLDQYLMNGGKTLWLVEDVAIEMQDLQQAGTTFAVRRDLNLTDFFFRYGIRVNPLLVSDIYSAPLVLATGNDSNSQYDPYPWFYTPLSASAHNHPIVNNIEAVKFEFVNAIDTLENGIQKTVLLSSSPFTKEVGVPAEISLNEIESNIEIINQPTHPKDFSAGEIPLAVLLEGSFTSAFKNRLHPFKLPNYKDQSTTTQMVVISDGDVIKNQLQNGRPMELGFDKWTQSRYGNKEFLLNTVNYLLDDNGLINIRSKKIAVAFMDSQKIVQQRTQWQLLNIVTPIVLLVLFGLLFQWYRKKKNT